MVPDDPKAANEGEEARRRYLRRFFEAMQAAEKQENPWLRQYYGEETLKKLGIKSLKVQEAQDDEIKNFTSLQGQRQKALKGFLLDTVANRSGQNYNLASVLDT